MRRNESLSTGRVAKILGVDRSTVTLYCRRGALKSSRTPTGRYLVSREDLDVFIREMERRVDERMDAMRSRENSSGGAK